MASNLFHGCPRGCGKRVWYVGTNTKFRKGFYECQRCFCQFSTAEMFRLGFIRKKSKNAYIPKKHYNILKLAKGEV